MPYSDDYEDFNNEAAELLEQQSPITEQTFVDGRAVEDRVEKFIFTFGFSHVWPLTGTSMSKEYVALRGTLDGTRNEMNRRFGDRWSFQYLYNAEAERMIAKYELAELRLEFPDGKAEFK